LGVIRVIRLIRVIRDIRAIGVITVIRLNRDRGWLSGEIRVIRGY
jgi:hypothetical protein